MKTIGSLLHGGKTKRVFHAGKSRDRGSLALIHTLDDVTVGDGAQKFNVPGLGQVRSEISAGCFRLLEKHGVRSHFVGYCDDTSETFVEEVQPLPFEVVFRFLADGSYLKRNPEVVAGTEFKDPVVEFFYKDDVAHDPYVVFGEGDNIALHRAKEPVTEASLIETRNFWQSLRGASLVVASPAEFSRIVREQAVNVATILRSAFKDQELILVDGKFEFGVSTKDGQIILSDSIDPDSLRLFVGHFGGLRLDKEFLRQIIASGRQPSGTDLAGLLANYRQVAAAVSWF